MLARRASLLVLLASVLLAVAPIALPLPPSSAAAQAPTSAQMPLPTASDRVPSPVPRPEPPPGADVPVDVGVSVRNDVSPALGSLRPRSPSDDGTRTTPRLRRPRDGQGRRSAAAVDPVLQVGAALGAMPPPLFTFEGLSNRDNRDVAGVDVIPPDTTGDVGPNHYVQWVNVSFAIYRRSGERVYGPAPGNTLFTGFGGPCETTNDGDPIVLYDHLADRWLLSQFALPSFPSGPFYQCVAVSRTADPTGEYNRYQFLISRAKLNDYPKLGVWPDGYYLSYNQYRANSLSFAGAGLGVLEREKMLAGQPAGIVTFDLESLNPSYFGFLPADLDGPPPPAGAPGTFMSADDDIFGFSNDRLQIFELRANWANPAATRLDGPLVLPTAPFDANLCNFFLSCLPQPTTTSRLDSLSDRLMWRLQYRNIDGRQVLVANHTVDVDDGDHAGIRWYELRKDGGGPWSIFQQGTYSPDERHRWMGSIAMDGGGNIALGFSVTGADLFPSIRYVGRRAGDPLGTLPRSEAVLFAGTGAQRSSQSRWGDYSQLAVDPVDDCTLFYTNQYYAQSTSRDWQTRVGAFRFDGCARPSGTASPTPTPTVTAATPAPTATATATATATPTSTPTPEPTAVRASADGRDDSPRALTEEGRQQRERTNRLGLDDARTEGDVVAVRCSLAAPVPTIPPSSLVAVPDDGDVPYVVIVTRDGGQVVRLLRAARAACGSIGVGSYLEADGTKQHEGLFEADDVTITRPRR